MLLKARTESEELRQYRFLEPRMDFDLTEKQQLINLEKGYAGELEFDRRVSEIGCNFLTINDVLLEKQGTYFQLDSLFISVDVIYLFEIKSFEGDYYIIGDKWYTRTGTEIQNPLLQVARSESLLRRYLQAFHPSLPIKSYLIFINPEFTLYQAPLNDTMIFPTQLQRFLKDLLSKKPFLKENHKNLARKIVSGHQVKNPFSRSPHYTYEELDKGIPCRQCKSMKTMVVAGQLICSRCSNGEKVDSAILRSTEEFEFLFPELRVTTNTVYEWCGESLSKKTVRRVLGSHYELIGHGRTANFIKKNVQ